MARPLPPVAVAVVSVLFWAVVTNPPAKADPRDTCTFALSPPTAITLASGAKVVTASFQASHCSGNAQALMSTVCVTPAGGAGQCAFSYGWDRAQVFFAPTDPATTYTASGNGQVRNGRNVTEVPIGPIRVTL